MRKRLLTTAVAALAICIASGASATQSRLNSMGGGIKNITVLDERNIFQLPAELVKWGTWTGIEIGAPGFNSFGIHYNFNPTTVLALYGTSQTKDAVKINIGNIGSVNQSGAFPNTGDAGKTHKGTLIFGIDLGSVRIGALLGLWADRVSATDATGAQTKNEGPLVLDFAFGIGVDLGGIDLDMALDIEFGTPTHFGPDAGGTNTDLSNNSQFDIGLLTRLTIPFSGPHELVPFLGFDMGFASGQLTAADSPQFSGFAIDVTLGMDIRLNLGEGITVQPGIGIQISHGSVSRTNADGTIDQSTASTFAIPFYNVAVDVQVTEWLDIRFGGAQRVIFKSSEEFTDSTTTGGAGESDVEHKLATGVGFNLPAGVSIDVEVSTGWWKQGPFLFTGDQAGSFGLNAALSKDW